MSMSQNPKLGQHLLEQTSPTGGDDESPVMHISQEERKLVDKCLNAVESRAKKLREKGLTTRNFIFGVANTIFVAWSFGALPQHFWIVYLLEVFMLFPLRFKSMVAARPKEHFYWLDFCWVANFGAVGFILILFTGHHLPYWAHERLFSAAWGIANGSLLCAAGALNNALIFHDFDNTASVIIHLMPALVTFNLGWRHQVVSAAWPGIFKVDFATLRPWQDIYFNAALFYFTWWIGYTVWLLTMGINLPKYQYDTIFHYTMRGSNGATLYSMLRKSKEDLKTCQRNNGFTRGDALAYMVVHAACVLIANLVSLVCFWTEWVHVLIVGAATLSTIFHAAKRYTYYMTKIYAVDLRKSLGIPPQRHGSALFDAHS